jgi:hypothetical protein
LLVKRQSDKATKRQGDKAVKHYFDIIWSPAKKHSKKMELSRLKKPDTVLMLYLAFYVYRMHISSSLGSAFNSAEGKD